MPSQAPVSTCPKIPPPPPLAPYYDIEWDSLSLSRSNYPPLAPYPFMHPALGYGEKRMRKKSEVDGGKEKI
uniref:Uncharacterized protein n=1 Tax=Bracon brevicornis TaxID=1563983 RepID=A0A6V7KI65_9HYME